MELAGPWLDVTDELPAGSPFTLARGDGIGAFHFSSALYRGGVVPAAGTDVLRQMLWSFGREKGLGVPADVRVHQNDTDSVGGSFVKGDHIRVWYLSNGRDFIFASYTSSIAAAEELAQCEAMVRSIEFKENWANKQPLPIPASVTPAADASVAPPSRAAGL